MNNEVWGYLVTRGYKYRCFESRIMRFDKIIQRFHLLRDVFLFYALAVRLAGVCCVHSPCHLSKTTAR